MNPLLQTSYNEVPPAFVAQVRPYTMKELCNIYQVTSKTLLKWLQPFSEEIGERRGRFYTVLQVEKIFHRIGVPY